MKSILFLISFIFLSSCTGTPKDISAVSEFDLNKYLGTWYEIARLDHSFEKGLTNVTANYSLNPDGTVKVINKGYSKKKESWKTAEGKAKFVGKNSTGHLKVSFFGPFYGAYVIFELEKENYSYAYVTSYNKDFLWFLSRSPTITEEELIKFKKTILDLGFAAEDLIIVSQDPPNTTINETAAGAATDAAKPRPL